MLASEIVEQSAAVCVRTRASGEIEVLLITTRSTGRWCIPKGWPIKGLKPHQVAEREAWEEAGIKGKAKKKPLSYYTYLKLLDDGSSVPSLVSVHLLKTSAVADEYPEASERVREWVTPPEAARRVQEPELKGIFSGMQTGALVKILCQMAPHPESLKVAVPPAPSLIQQTVLPCAWMSRLRIVG
jgi:8-oxo-dGTP pyrophosphatase MutT (NUDIX family)